MSNNEVRLPRELAINIFESIGFNESDLDYILSASNFSVSLQIEIWNQLLNSKKLQEKIEKITNCEKVKDEQ